jgi:hypothetical protein
MWPVKVTLPEQSPPVTPVAMKSSGLVDGTLVTPGLTVNVPVGAAGVPAQVHVLAALADAVP